MSNLRSLDRERKKLEYKRLRRGLSPLLKRTIEQILHKQGLDEALRVLKDHHARVVYEEPKEQDV